MLLCAALSVLAWALQRFEERLFTHAIVEALVLALVLGVAWRNLVGGAALLRSGADWCAKPLLETAVLLLGAGMNLRELTAGGPRLILAIAVAVPISLAGGTFLARRFFGLEKNPATLIAVGNSICGNSAIAAVAPIIGASATEVAGAIAFTAVLGVAVVLLLPLSIPLLGLDHHQYGVLAGMTVYAVPQVLAASFPVSELAGRTGTLVKLTRVLFLGPVAIVLGLLRHRGSATKVRLGQAVPWFITGFVLLATARTLGWLPEGPGQALREASRWMTVAAMAGLGLGVDVRALRTAGLRTAGAVSASLLLLMTVSVLLIRLLGLH